MPFNNHIGLFLVFSEVSKCWKCKAHGHYLKNNTDISVPESKCCDQLISARGIGKLQNVHFVDVYVQILKTHAVTTLWSKYFLAISVAQHSGLYRVRLTVLSGMTVKELLFCYLSLRMHAFTPLSTRWGNHPWVQIQRHLRWRVIRYRCCCSWKHRFWLCSCLCLMWKILDFAAMHFGELLSSCLYQK